MKYSHQLTREARGLNKKVIPLFFSTKDDSNKQK
jgi:hypothetical protein